MQDCLCSSGQTRDDTDDTRGRAGPAQPSRPKEHRPMAHNIAVINGQDAIAYIDDTPWHGLGQRLKLADVPPAQRIDAALDAAQMRWTAGSLPLYLADGTEVQGHKASV